METIIGTDLNTAATFLKDGQLVAIPTETVYGLAGNALDPDAVLAIFETKGRPQFNPLIVHVHDQAEFAKYASDVPPLVNQLASRFCPGPLTFVLPKKSIIPDLVTGGGDTVALRVPDHRLTLELLRQLDFPLAAPSANPFGYISPVTAKHVADQLAGKIPYILDGGACHVGLESTVVTVKEETVYVLRLGGITIEDLKLVTDKVVLQNNQSSNPKSPGQLKTHYAPRMRLVLGNLDQLIEQYQEKKMAVISLKNKYNSANILFSEQLSSNGNLTEAARSLFSVMRKADQSEATIILAERMPESGLGFAINDRLERAAADHFF
jgi:L-threonylcarbamoyladenylate synthase